MAVNDKEFGELKGMVEATLDNTKTILIKFDSQLDSHEKRITIIEAQKAGAEKETKKMYGAVGLLATGISLLIGVVKGWLV